MFCILRLLTPCHFVLLLFIHDKFPVLKYSSLKLLLLLLFYFDLCSVQFSSVTQSCLTICDLWSAAHWASLSITNSQSLLKLMSIESWCHPNISSSVVPFSSCLQFSPASESSPVSQFFISGGQSIGVSASASVLPMNIQDWFPLGWTHWISLQSKGLSRVFSNTTVQKHQFFGAQFSL